MIPATDKNFKKIHEVRWHALDDLSWNYRMKQIFLIATVAMITVKISYTHFHSSSCQGNIFLRLKSCTLLVQTITENGVQQKKITEENLSQSCILCQLLRKNTLASGSKCTKHFFKKFYHYLPYIFWMDEIYLTWLVFLNFSSWIVWIFSAPAPLTWK